MSVATNMAGKCPSVSLQITAAFMFHVETVSGWQLSHPEVTPPPDLKVSSYIHVM